MTLWDEAAVERAARVFCRITMEDWSVKPPGRDWTEEEVASAVEADWSSFTGEAELILNAAISLELRELIEAELEKVRVGDQPWFGDGNEPYDEACERVEKAALTFAKAVRGE